jgi:hypothetical protein
MLETFEAFETRLQFKKQKKQSSYIAGQALRVPGG